MSDQPQALWLAAQQTLRGMLKTELYNLWFAPVTARCLDGDTLTLEVADEFCEFWLKDNYLDVLRSVVSRTAIRPIQVVFAIRPAEAAVAAPADSASERPMSAETLMERVASTEVRVSEPAVREISRKSEPLFNPNNTFETFVVGSNNHHAHAACMGVAQKPGHTYNPLFLFGGVGLGKTHLLQAIGHHVLANKKNARIGYLSCERFTNEFIEALQNSQLPKFRKKHRELDVLLIDDIQFLQGKERIQEEFFHTFNALHDAHKQIVLTCDRPANEIQGLEQRLISRFEWGMTADLKAPDVETRLAILNKKAAALSVRLPDQIIMFLANRIRTNVRRLEGALVRVAAYAQLSGKILDLETVETLLREILQEEGKVAISVSEIQKRVADYFDIRLADMTSKRRPENIAFPRQIAMYLTRQLTEHSLSAIGESFGGRDHGTVLHACRQVRDRMEVEAKVRQDVGYLEKQLTR
ncbi:MAG: chromosomal replication initiator protein DnaA [Verrucomicrobia bacterium]|jgi:chromosomal replication initiator protein|nr:chromosomal replication initiator protein DnaA [Verrucomicrobiota bacterium]